MPLWYFRLSNRRGSGIGIAIIPLSLPRRFCSSNPHTTLQCPSPHAASLEYAKTRAPISFFCTFSFQPFIPCSLLRLSPDVYRLNVWTAQWFFALILCGRCTFTSSSAYTTHILILNACKSSTRCADPVDEIILYPSHFTHYRVISRPYEYSSPHPLSRLLMHISASLVSQLCPISFEVSYQSSMINYPSWFGFVTHVGGECAIYASRRWQTKGHLCWGFPL